MEGNGLSIECTVSDSIIHSWLCWPQIAIHWATSVELLKVVKIDPTNYVSRFIFKGLLATEVLTFFYFNHSAHDAVNDFYSGIIADCKHDVIDELH